MSSEVKQILVLVQNLMNILVRQHRVSGLAMSTIVFKCDKSTAYLGQVCEC